MLRPMHRLPACALFVLVAPCAALLAVDDFDSRRVNDVRLSLGAVQQPDVSEKVTGNGPEVSYDWVDDRLAGVGVRLEYMARVARLGKIGGLLVGIGATYEYFDTTPDSFAFSAGSASNPTSYPSTTLQTLRGELSFGWASPVMRGGLGGWWHVEATAFAAYGPAWGNTQDFDDNGAFTQNGDGFSTAFGPRVGLFFCTSPWIFGVQAEYRFADTEIETALNGNRTSTTTYDGDGAALWLTTGYRF